MASEIEQDFWNDASAAPEPPAGGGAAGAVRRPDVPAANALRPDASRIMLVEGQTLVRDLLTLWLNGIGRGTRIIACADVETCLARSRDGEVALIVVGCLAHEEWDHGILGAVESIVADRPGVPVAVVAEKQDSGLMVRAIQAGARAFIPTALEPSVALAAVRLVLAGGVFIPAETVVAAASNDHGVDPAGFGRAVPADREALGDGVVPGAACGPRPVERVIGLTHRETEILALIERGWRNRQIAEALGISGSTVVVHIHNLMQKLGATNRTQAVALAQRLLARRTASRG